MQARQPTAGADEPLESHWRATGRSMISSKPALAESMPVPPGRGAYGIFLKPRWSRLARRKIHLATRSRTAATVPRLAGTASMQFLTVFWHTMCPDGMDDWPALQVYVGGDLHLHAALKPLASKSSHTLNLPLCDMVKMTRSVR